MKKNNYIEFRRYSDFQFNAILLDVVQKYFRLKKSCEIAEKILKENCHDFYFPLDMSEINNSYCEVMNVAAERNIPVNYSISDFECSVEEVAHVLNTMCGLELSWLDENRVIFDKDDVDGLATKIISVCEARLFPKEECIARSKDFAQQLKFKEYIYLYE